VFIDFGMTAVISRRIKAALRTMAIGIGIRDARKVVPAHATAGVLQPVWTPCAWKPPVKTGSTGWGGANGQVPRKYRKRSQGTASALLPGI